MGSYGLVLYVHATPRKKMTLSLVGAVECGHHHLVHGRDLLDHFAEGCEYLGVYLLRVQLRARGKRCQLCARVMSQSGQRIERSI